MRQETDVVAIGLCDCAWCDLPDLSAAPLMMIRYYQPWYFRN